MTRYLLCALLSWVLSGIGSPAASAALRVTEADLKTYRDLEYAETLYSTRVMWARRDAGRIASAQAERDKAWSQSGWTRERFDDVEVAIGEVLSYLSSAKSGDISAEDLKAGLAESDPTTVATVKAHCDELEAVRDSERAEKQVREEIARERAGTPPTEAELCGSWSFDVDATLELTGLAALVTGADREALKAETLAKAGMPSYTFGPGNAMVSRVKIQDGSERVDKGIFRLDGNKLYLKAENSKNEHEMHVGIRNSQLIIGSGMFAGVFIRQ